MHNLGPGNIDPNSDTPTPEQNQAAMDAMLDDLDPAVDGDAGPLLVDIAEKGS